MAIDQFLTPKGLEFFKKLETKVLQSLFDLVDDDNDSILKTVGAFGFFVTLKETFNEDVDKAIQNLDSDHTIGGETDASRT